MPGRDGTGPTGKGPMTGTCSGSCILRIPDNQDEPIQGFAGEAGWPVSFGVKPEREQEEFDMPRGDGKGPTGAGPRTGRMKGFAWVSVPLGLSIVLKILSSQGEAVAVKADETGFQIPD